jgi:divalent metal cation (Fe/Co/Zn/Cd) transporter
MTGWAWLDSVIAMVFAVVIIITGYRVLRRSLAGIMDEADEALLKNVVAVLQEFRKPQWIDLHNLRVIQYGDVLHVDAHMTLPWYYRVGDAEQEIHMLEKLISDNFGGQVELFIHIDGCMPYSCRLCAVKDCPVRQHPFTGQVEWTLVNVWANKKHGEL